METANQPDDDAANAETDKSRVNEWIEELIAEMERAEDWGQVLLAGAYQNDPGGGIPTMADPAQIQRTNAVLRLIRETIAVIEKA